MLQDLTEISGSSKSQDIRVESLERAVRWAIESTGVSVEASVRPLSRRDISDGWFTPAHLAGEQKVRIPDLVQPLRQRAQREADLEGKGRRVADIDTWSRRYPHVVSELGRRCCFPIVALVLASVLDGRDKIPLIRSTDYAIRVNRDGAIQVRLLPSAQIFSPDLQRGCAEVGRVLFEEMLYPSIQLLTGKDVIYRAGKVAASRLVGGFVAEWYSTRCGTAEEAFDQANSIFSQLCADSEQFGTMRLDTCTVPAGTEPELNIERGLPFFTPAECCVRDKRLDEEKSDDANLCGSCPRIDQLHPKKIADIQQRGLPLNARSLAGRSRGDGNVSSLGTLGIELSGP